VQLLKSLAPVLQPLLEDKSASKDGKLKTATQPPQVTLIDTETGATQQVSWTQLTRASNPGWSSTMPGFYSDAESSTKVWAGN